MTSRHKKTCRDKLVLSNGTLMFTFEENFSDFCNFFDQGNFSIEDCTFLHCSALEYTNIFVQLSLDITFHAIECGVTTCPRYGESCHRWPSHIFTIKGNPMSFNCSQGFTQNLGMSQSFLILNAKNTKILKQNMWQLAPVYPTNRSIFLILGFPLFLRFLMVDK